MMQIICLFGSSENTLIPATFTPKPVPTPWRAPAQSSSLRLQDFANQNANFEQSQASNEGADLAQDDRVLMRVLNMSCLHAT